MDELLSRLALAFGVGLLMGLERGWNSRQVKPGSRAAGVRTFAIIGLLGGLVGAIARTDAGTLEAPGALLIGLALIAFSAVIALFTREENIASGKHSATTAIAAVLTFVLGVFALVGDVHVTTAAAVAATGVLALRDGLHGWVAKITRPEMESGLLLLAMTFIALPILPEQPIAPLGGINVREVWIIAIALASVSFVAYIAVRYFGERKGVLISAVIGGLVSSTAVAFTSARRAAAGEGSPATLAAATAVATAVSFIRVIAIAAVLSPAIAFQVGVPLAAATLVACALAALLVYRTPAPKPQQVGAVFRNPFNFWSVLFMAVSIGVLVVLGTYINARFGASGAMVGAASMGLFDVDAMTVSMARLVPASLTPLAGSGAILAGVASNTLVKAAIAGAMGRGRFALDVTIVTLSCVVAGAVAMFAVRSIS